MPNDLRTDPLIQSLAGLPALDLDPECAARLRKRCHAELERRRRQAFPTFVAGDLFRRVLEPAVINGACALYLVEVIRRAAALYGL
jgi:hypothetical protein